MLQINNREREELLHFACKNGQISLIRNLLKDIVDINALNAKGLTPLHLTVIEGNIEVTKLLISEGANIEIKDSRSKSSPLLYACQNGRTKLLQLLLESGSDINAKSADGTSAIHFATQSGRTDMVKLLLQKGFDVNCKNKFGETPLYYLLYPRPFPIFHKVIDMCAIAELLIKSGAKIDEATESKETPLIHAIQKNRTEFVKLLISYGVNVNCVSNSGATPLIIFTTKLDHDIEILNLLIDNGADINALNPEGLSPLHTAVIEGNMKLTKLLISKGSNIEIKDSTSRSSPLLYACQNGRTELFKMLLENGADVNAKSADGTSAIHFATQSANTEIVDLLLQRDLDINCKNNLGETPLYYTLYPRPFQAVSTAISTYKMAKFLIERGATIDVATVSDRTPLIHAITKNNLNVVNLLVSFGANVNHARGSYGTPLHIATTIVLHEHWEGCIEIANLAGLISSQGAKPRGMRNESQGI